MLVLSRKVGESIMIGDEVVVTIMEVGRGRVQVGITAPGHVPVYRNEIVERMIASGEIAGVGALASSGLTSSALATSGRESVGAR